MFEGSIKRSYGKFQGFDFDLRDDDLLAKKDFLRDFGVQILNFYNLTRTIRGFAVSTQFKVICHQ